MEAQSDTSCSHLLVPCGLKMDFYWDIGGKGNIQLNTVGSKVKFWSPVPTPPSQESPSPEPQGAPLSMVSCDWGGIFAVQHLYLFSWPHKPHSSLLQLKVWPQMAFATSWVMWSLKWAVKLSTILPGATPPDLLRIPLVPFTPRQHSPLTAVLELLCEDERWLLEVSGPVSVTHLQRKLVNRKRSLHSLSLNSEAGQFKSSCLWILSRTHQN